MNLLNAALAGAIQSRLLGTATITALDLLGHVSATVAGRTTPETAGARRAPLPAADAASATPVTLGALLRVNHGQSLHLLSEGRAQYHVVLGVVDRESVDWGARLLPSSCGGGIRNVVDSTYPVHEWRGLEKAIVYPPVCV